MHPRLQGLSLFPTLQLKPPQAKPDPRRRTQLAVQPLPPVSPLRRRARIFRYQRQMEPDRGAIRPSPALEDRTHPLGQASQLWLQLYKAPWVTACRDLGHHPSDHSLL